jgi:cephalosporin-C deacetylase
VSDFWAELLAETMSRPPAPEVDPLPIRSAEFADGYGVKLTSGIGDYRLFAYYSVPKGDGGRPAIYHAPGYASVVQVPPYEERRRHVVLSLAARGTHHVDDVSRWPLRGIVGDAVRGIDFLKLRDEVDKARMVVVGGDMALFTAALRPEVRAAVVTDPFLLNLWAIAASTDAYPQEEINDYLRAHPERRDAVRRTLEQIDPAQLADRVRCDVLLSCGPGYFGRAEAEQLAARLGGRTEIRERTGRGYVDRKFVEAWIAERTGARIDDPYPATSP